MKSKTVIVSGKKIRIPFELYRAMGKPKLVRIAPLPKPDVAKISKFSSADQIFYIAHRIKQSLIFPKTKRQIHIPELIKLMSADKDNAMYLNNSGFDFGHREFFIVNYHPGYFLMPKSNLSESKSREQSWAQIKKYHEHLLVDLQDESANKVSNWLAGEVFKKFKAKSFLEIGCGAGRNLIYIHKNIKRAKTIGIDINAVAIKVAKSQLKRYDSTLLKKSVYDLKSFADNSIDIVFSCGVLMHIPHSEVINVIKQMQRIAKIAVVHFELDGPSHQFDYHRYPRNYLEIYDNLHISNNINYRKFPPGDFRSNMSPPFCHALLVSEIDHHA